MSVEANSSRIIRVVCVLRPPFVMGYDVVGEIDQLGDGVRKF